MVFLLAIEKIQFDNLRDQRLQLFNVGSKRNRDLVITKKFQLVFLRNADFEERRHAAISAVTNSLTRNPPHRSLAPRGSGRSIRNLGCEDRNRMNQSAGRDHAA